MLRKLSKKAGKIQEKKMFNIFIKCLELTIYTKLYVIAALGCEPPKPCGSEMNITKVSFLISGESLVPKSAKQMEKGNGFQSRICQI